VAGWCFIAEYKHHFRISCFFGWALLAPVGLFGLSAAHDWGLDKKFKHSKFTDGIKQKKFPETMVKLLNPVSHFSIIRDSQSDSVV
jgi:hypothetical protein